MTESYIRSFRSVIDEMKAAAKGKRPGKSAPKRSFESKKAHEDWIRARQPQSAYLVDYDSVESLARILTEENRKLLNLIAEKRPASIVILAKWLDRAPSNVTRTLSKLERLGIVVLVSGEGKTKIPRLNVEKLRFELDVRSGKIRIGKQDILMATEGG